MTWGSAIDQILGSGQDYTMVMLLLICDVKDHPRASETIVCAKRDKEARSIDYDEAQIAAIQRCNSVAIRPNKKLIRK